MSHRWQLDHRFNKFFWKPNDLKVISTHWAPIMTILRTFILFLKADDFHSTRQMMITLIKGELMSLWFSVKNRSKLFGSIKEDTKLLSVFGPKFSLFAMAIMSLSLSLTIFCTLYSSLFALSLWWSHDMATFCLFQGIIFLPLRLTCISSLPNLQW